jgi:hypothetical protein
MTDRSLQAMVFLDTVDQTPPQAVSACDGWTTHEIAAHVTGIAVEVIRHLDPYLQGDPVPPTRSFEEREAPLQALEHPALLDRLDTEEQRMRRVVDEVLKHDPEPDADFRVRLRTAGQPDLRVLVDRSGATLAWAQDDTDEPAVEMDAGARQLFIWGRRPDHRGRLRSHLEQPQLARLQALLSGY